MLTTLGVLCVMLALTVVMARIVCHTRLDSHNCDRIKDVGVWCSGNKTVWIEVCANNQCDTVYNDSWDNNTVKVVF